LVAEACGHSGRVIRSVKIVEIIADANLFGIGVSQEDAILRLPVITKNVVIFQNIEIVKKPELVFD
jgi:hypothetical protein